MKVKYLGERGLRYHNIDFFKGDTRTVADDLQFPKDLFEILDKPKSEKKKDKKED